MDNYKRRRIYLVAGIVIAIIMVATIIWAMVSNESGRRTPDGEEPDITVTIDPDTGDEIVDVPGKDPEPSPFEGVTVLGGSKLIDNTTATYDQYDQIVTVVERYAKEHVGDINTIKFLPDSIELRASSPSGVPTQYYVQVKTVDPETTLHVTIHLIRLDKVRLVINNPTKPELGTYDSGVFPPPSENIDSGR